MLRKTKMLLHICSYTLSQVLSALVQENLMFNFIVDTLIHSSHIFQPKCALFSVLTVSYVLHCRNSSGDSAAYTEKGNYQMKKKSSTSDSKCNVVCHENNLLFLPELGPQMWHFKGCTQVRTQPVYWYDLGHCRIKLQGWLRRKWSFWVPINPLFCKVVPVYLVLVLLR